MSTNLHPLLTLLHLLRCKKKKKKGGGVATESKREKGVGTNRTEKGRNHKWRSGITREEGH